MHELPKIMMHKIEYFFQHYKDLEPNAWSKIAGWADRDATDKIIMTAIERYNKAHGKN